MAFFGLNIVITMQILTGGVLNYDAVISHVYLEQPKSELAFSVKISSVDWFHSLTIETPPDKYHKHKVHC